MGSEDNKVCLVSLQIPETVRSREGFINVLFLSDDSSLPFSFLDNTSPPLAVLPFVPHKVFVFPFCFPHNAIRLP